MPLIFTFLVLSLESGILSNEVAAVLLGRFAFSFALRLFSSKGKNVSLENFTDKCFKTFLDNILLAKENVPTVKKKRPS